MFIAGRVAVKTTPLVRCPVLSTFRSKRSEDNIMLSRVYKHFAPPTPAGDIRRARFADNPKKSVRLKRFPPGFFEMMVDWTTTQVRVRSK